MTRLDAIDLALDVLEYARLEIENRPMTWNVAENERAARQLRGIARRRDALEAEFELVLIEGREAAA